MWTPNSAEEVERVVAEGALPETEVFDAKAALPEARKNADLAWDVAAMSTVGGVLLYGVGEAADGRPTVLARSSSRASASASIRSSGRA